MQDMDREATKDQLNRSPSSWPPTSYWRRSKTLRRHPTTFHLTPHGQKRAISTAGSVVRGAQKNGLLRDNG